MNALHRNDLGWTNNSTELGIQLHKHFIADAFKFVYVPFKLVLFSYIKSSESYFKWAWLQPVGFRINTIVNHQCLAGTWKRRLGCHAGRQEVGRCRTRGESQGMCNATGTPLLSLNKAEPTLALKPRGDVTRSPKQGYQWPRNRGISGPTKRTHVLQKFF